MSSLIRWIKRLESREAPKTIVATAATTIAHTDAIRGVVVSNKGAAGEVVISLPAAVPGMRVTGVVQAAQLLSLDPVDTEIIYGTNGVALTEDAAIKANAIGETIQLVCVEAGFWVVTASAGTWSATGA
jgi:hypothetical protein